MTGIGILLVGIGFIVFTRYTQGASVADNESSVLGFILAAFGAILSLVGRWVEKRQLTGLPATAEQINQAAETLTGLIIEQWSAEAVVLALNDPEPMPVRWRLSNRLDLMDRPGTILPGTPLNFSGVSTDIDSLASAFRALPRRRLVISGGPGSGKTTLAVQLICKLSETLNAKEPVPVFFSLPDWDLDLHPSFRGWLTSQINSGYPPLRAISLDVAASLVAQGRVLPVLDGLDEVDQSGRGRMLERINSELVGGLILTSRRDEYAAAVAEAHDVLTAAAVIVPFMLSPQDSASYLEKSVPSREFPRWTTTLVTLRSGGAANLATVSSTPFGLWMVRTIYADGRLDPARLIDSTFATPKNLWEDLFGLLLPTLIQIRPPEPRRLAYSPSTPLRPARAYDASVLKLWLQTIARDLNSSGTREWPWWALARRTFPSWLSRLGLRAMLGIMAAVGAVFALELVALPVAYSAIELGGGFNDGTVTRGAWLSGAWLTNLQFGLLLGLATAVFSRLRPNPRHVDFQVRGRVRQLLTLVLSRALAGALLGFLISIFILSFTSNPFKFESDLALTLVLVGGGIGLAVGIRKFIRSTPALSRPVTPNRSYSNDRKLAFGQSIIVFLVFTVAVGITPFVRDIILGTGSFGLESLPFVGYIAAQIGLPAAIAFGPVGTAWVTFVTTASFKKLYSPSSCPPPWRIMPVLEDCHRLGLLRSIGPIYQFRHSQLQDYLAN